MSMMGIASNFLRPVTHSVGRMKYVGSRRTCPVCGHASRNFAPMATGRRNARCVHCGSLERHRLVLQFMRRFTDLFNGTPDKHMLHVAPEECLVPVFRQALGNRYITADLYDSRADMKMDVTDMQVPDHSYDVIYCNHVLEHIEDDRKAMKEFKRVLKPTGWAILNVPVDAARTYENPAIRTEAEREKHFGQSDHVRRYGPDYADRLREAGFRVQIFGVPDIVGLSDAERIGVADNALATGKIYFCT